MSIFGKSGESTISAVQSLNKHFGEDVKTGRTTKREFVKKSSNDDAEPGQVGGTRKKSA